jgi:hypothetical protein
MISKTFKTTIVRDGSMCFIPLTFDPKTVFGKVRALVTVTLNGYTYRQPETRARRIAGAVRTIKALPKRNR